MKLLAFDTETGGLDPKDASLLTAYFEVLDDDLETVDSLMLLVKPEDGLFKAHPQALAVNKINLDTHRSEAISYPEARVKLKQFLMRHSSKYDKLTPVAHNIDFDLGFIHERLMPKNEWESQVSYRKLDTANLGNFFRLCGVLSSNQKFNLGDLAYALGVTFDGAAHSADADTKAMVDVLRAFVTMGRRLSEKNTTR